MLSILIIDDDRDILSSLRRSLLRVGFDEIFLSTDPKKALQLLKKRNINIVITDIVMPEMNGVDLLKKIYQIRKKIKVIIMTVLDDFKIANKKINNEIIAVLDKPLNLYSLIDLLHESEKSLPMAS